jgi:hypothetical protein
MEAINDSSETESMRDDAINKIFFENAHKILFSAS